MILTRRHLELPNLAKVILMIRRIRLFPCVDVDPAHPAYAKSNAANSEEDDKDADAPIIERVHSGDLKRCRRGERFERRAH